MKVKELGHIVLYVSDLARSRPFYGETLGWREITPEEGIGCPAAAFASGRTHHELLLIEVRGAPALPRGRRLGLYHFGLKIGETDDELREARDELVAAGVRIAGATDHGVTHSLYIEGPHGDEIELYIDVQPPRGKGEPGAMVRDPLPPPPPL